MKKMYNLITKSKINAVIFMMGLLIIGYIFGFVMTKTKMI